MIAFATGLDILLIKRAKNHLNKLLSKHKANMSIVFELPSNCVQQSSAGFSRFGGGVGGAGSRPLFAWPTLPQIRFRRGGGHGRRGGSKLESSRGYETPPRRRLPVEWPDEKLIPSPLPSGPGDAPTPAPPAPPPPALPPEPYKVRLPRLRLPRPGAPPDHPFTCAWQDFYRRVFTPRSFPRRA